MKRILLLAVITAFTALNASSQCAPDTSLAPGVYPDSATNFMPAYVGQPYEQIVQAVVPADTCVVIFAPPCQNVPFEYIEVVSITGLPPNFTYDCVPADCKMPGDSAGCVRIYSTVDPVIADTGTYNLSIELDAVVNIGGFPTSNPTTVDYYFIEVLPPQGITTPEGISGLEIYPNPADEVVQARFSVGSYDNVVITLTDLIGKRVYSERFRPTSGVVQKSIDVSDLNSGMYLYTIQHDGHSVTKKLVIE